MKTNHLIITDVEANSVSLLCSYFLLKCNGADLGYEELEVLTDSKTLEVIANFQNKVMATLKTNRNDRQN